MTRFIRDTFSRLLALFIFCFLFLFFGVSCATCLGALDNTMVIDDGILMVSLDQKLVEQGVVSPFSGSPWADEFGLGGELGLDQVLDAIQQASEDEKIHALVLDIDGVNCGWAQMNAIRKALSDFKASGKPLQAYLERVSMRNLYLTSVADKISVNPLAHTHVVGPSIEITYYQKLLSELGVKPEIIYAGDFKSATEPFRRKDMSPENRAQLGALLKAFRDEILQGIAEGRGLDLDELDSKIKEGGFHHLEEILQNRIIDEQNSEIGFLKALKQKLLKDAHDDQSERSDDDDKQDTKLTLIRLQTYIQHLAEKKTTGQRESEFNFSGSAKIAWLYAEGGIVDGNPNSNARAIASKAMIRELRKISKQDNLKALVLRVNSPGGSALASEVILSEIKELKQRGVTIIVSMGDMAASGGYYIAALADEIIADPLTITGSIGVFSMMFNGEELLKDKAKLSFDHVVLDQGGDFPQSPLLNRALKSEERSIFEKQIMNVYNIFKGHVAVGREMTLDEVEAVAKGRVWTGREAQSKGLVDKLMQVNAVLPYVRQLLDDEDANVHYYPKAPTPWDFLEDLVHRDEILFEDNVFLSPFLKKWQDVQSLLNGGSTQARTPYELRFH